MALIISYRIIYLLWNVTPVATRGINEEPNIYVVLGRIATQITPSFYPPPFHLSYKLEPWKISLYTCFAFSTLRTDKKTPFFGR